MTYPNARARLRRVRKVPGAAASESELTIWLRDRRFRVSDSAGRPYREILADVTAPRGFGAPPRTMEDFMDAFDASLEESDFGPTELSGDLSTGEGTVRQPREQPWPVDADRIAPVAEQVLWDPALDALPGTGEVDRLGRPCRRLGYVLEGVEDGVPYRSDVAALVSRPFVMRREVRDAVNPEGLWMVTEVVELEEGAVTDADLISPAP